MLLVAAFIIGEIIIYNVQLVAAFYNGIEKYNLGEWLWRDKNWNILMEFVILIISYEPIYNLLNKYCDVSIKNSDRARKSYHIETNPLFDKAKLILMFVVIRTMIIPIKARHGIGCNFIDAE